MKKPFFAHLLVVTSVCLTALCVGDEIKTTDGRLYKDVMVIEETATHVKFKHADGLAKLPRERLVLSKAQGAVGDAPVTVSKFDSTKRVIFIKSKAASIKTKDGRMFLSKDLVDVQPNQMKFVTDSGIFKIKFTDLPLDVAVALGWDNQMSEAQDSKDAEKKRQNDRLSKLYLNAESIVNSSGFDGKIRPFQRVNAGWLCDVSERRKETVTVETSRSFNALSQQVQVQTANVEVDVNGPSEIALVWGLSDSIVAQRPNQTWSSPLFLIGKYEYSDLGGDMTEVSIYFTERKEAIAHIVRNGLGVINDQDVGRKSGGQAIVKAHGSGFFITKDGVIATNHHVIEGAKSITVSTDGKAYSAKVVAIDTDSDLALLKIDSITPSFLEVKSNAETSVGDFVFTIGFPRPSSQGKNAKFTEGSISSLTGLDDSEDQLQISVPIQPGNSGGALVNSAASVVGVIVSTLNFSATVKSGSGLPQNVNYAVKSSLLQELCLKAKVTLPEAAEDGPASKSDRKDVIAKAQKSAVLIEVEIDEE